MAVSVQRQHVSYERVTACQIRNVLPAMTSLLHHNMCASCTHQFTCNHWTRASHSVWNKCTEGTYYIFYCEKETGILLQKTSENRRSCTPCKIVILSVLPTPVSRPTNYDFTFLVTAQIEPLCTMHILCECILGSSNFNLNCTFPGQLM